MGNNQSQHQNSNNHKQNKKDIIKQLFSSKKDIVFSRLTPKTLSLISSFLTMHEFNNLSLTSIKCYQLFSQTSGCFQVECHRLLNIKCDQILSQNWKKIIQSLICVPIRGLPYGEAIKSVRTQLKQLPCFIEQNINYSLFQKSILYYQNQFNQKKQIQNKQEFQEAKVFTANNIETILRVRQGQEIHTQLPEILMLIYNLHDYIKIYSLYLEIRFEKCNINQFISLWQHYKGWICSVEQQTFDLIYQFNEIIEDSLPQYFLPKYTIKNFMVCEWLKKANKGEIIVRLREEFRLNMIECRQSNKKNQDLREYIQYLIDISTNEYNIHQYGYYNFSYCQELKELIKITVGLSPKLNIDYLQDENMLSYIFGQYVYDYYIFEELQLFRTEQFKQEIRSHQNESQISSKILSKVMEEQNQTNQTQNNNFNGLDTSQFQYYIQTSFNVTLKIRTLFRQIGQICCVEDEPQTENVVVDSLGTSGISLTSTNCSSVFSSIKTQDQMYNYIKSHHPDLYHKIQLFYEKEQTIIQCSQQLEPKNENLFDIPELCDYYYVSYTELKELLQNRAKRSNAIFQYERRQTNVSLQQKQIISTEQSQAELFLASVFK